MKKGIIGLTCALTAATCFLFACNTAPDISKVKWSDAGITAETLTLPELELDEVKNSSSDGTGITVVWNGATEEEYDALVTECYTKIPANKSLFDESAEIGELKSENYNYNTFIATYTVSDAQYTCSVVYYKTDFAEYKADQLILEIGKANVNSLVVEYWDGIINENKTWFTADELAILGWEGVAAPDGDIMGKISDVGGDGLQIAIENTTKTEFDNFVKLLYDEHIKDRGEGAEFEDKEYNHEYFYRVDSSPAMVRFMLDYKVNDNNIFLFVVYRNSHIVIQASV
ncbi:MAG: hypothetical protein K2J83_07160 [Clostridia bacterium]|nr:hypothetical protein [Clostridia bacterium]